METIKQILFAIYVVLGAIFNSIIGLLKAFIYIFGALALIILPPLAIISIILVVVLIFIVRHSYMKAYNACLTGNYNVAISTGTKIIKFYYVVSKILFFPSVKRIVDDLNGMLAISFLAKKDNDKFLNHINAIKHRPELKNAWLCVYYLLQNDITNAEDCYKNLKELQQDNEIVDYINAIFLYKQGKVAEANDIMSAVYPKLKFQLAKDIADEFMKGAP